VDESVISQDEWEQGLSLTGLISGMTVNRDLLQRRYSALDLSEAEKLRLGALTVPRKLLVMTEEWCSDCMMNLPILARLAESSEKIEIRFFVRKDWPQLRAYFNSRDIFSLPTLQIMDEALNPLGTWVERPQAAHQSLAAWKEAHPEVEHTRRRADLTSEEKRELLREINEQLVHEMEEWYAQTLQSETVREVTEILEALEKDTRSV